MNSTQQIIQQDAESFALVDMEQIESELLRNRVTLERFRSFSAGAEAVIKDPQRYGISTHVPQSPVNAELETLKARLDGYERLLRIADVPELLIEYPNILHGKPTEKDIEWARGVIEKYQLKQQTTQYMAKRNVRQEKQYFLAETTEIDQYGTVWGVRLADGPHEDPKGVSEAQKIIKGVSILRGHKIKYVMVCIEPVPDIEVAVNQEAIDTINQASKYLKP